ncbi:MAG: hypothetical protein IJW28_00160 [Clostridia bacterium]|nr:hypothetical protein [Clostridia bacterium]
MKKEYVKVISETDTSGIITPKTIIWKDDTKFTIDKVLDHRPCASLKTGGVGIRYTIQINSTITHLFLEETKWFVEAKMT